MRVQRWETHVDVSQLPSDTGAFRRTYAATKLRDSAEALGELRVRLLEVCVLHDYSWRQISERLHVSDKTAANYTAEAISALSDW